MQKALKKTAASSKNLPTQAGFTLVETLVAIAILTLSITVPFYSVQRALIASYTARDQLVATNLAQEGLEFVKSVRDQNFLLHSSDWLANFDGASTGTITTIGYDNGFANCLNGRLCVVDAASQMVSQCSDSVCTMRNGVLGYPLYLSSTGWYNEVRSGSPSRFTRTMTINVLSTTEVKVIVTVSWQANGTAHNVQVSEYLENWL